MTTNVNPWYRCPACGVDFPVENVEPEIGRLRQRVRELETAILKVMSPAPVSETLPELERVLIAGRK